ncbi:hypothetical protein [Sphingomonas fuzhouensis]|uniref:hypothetical protein n=1 Tax=Sphingomonas fuzhouensis TaxID=3106033 RepID=UPI002AFEA537|nr:hypothetical protein [Sphingomonas sp. SGZ-02]
MSESTTEHSDNEAFFRRHWWGYGIAALILYAFTSPYLKYVPAGQVFACAALISVTVLSLYWGTIYLKRVDGKFWFGMGVCMGVFAFLLTLYTSMKALDGADANAKRCLAIQRDMLSAHPRRSDDPDLFQALGCAPSGEGSVSAAPTDRERKAGHPLPWGGYPPSR